MRGGGFGLCYIAAGDVGRTASERNLLGMFVGMFAGDVCRGVLGEGYCRGAFHE